MAQPAAEFDIDEDLVRRLLRSQHPDLAELPLVEFGEGWDNTIWRLGENLAVRLPRRAAAVLLTEHEQRWLPELVGKLPLAVPAPVRVGAAGVGFPWPWSIVPWLEGTPGDVEAVTSSVGTAELLGCALRALHEPAPAELPRNPYRGVRLVERAAAFEERLDDLGGEVDVEACREVFADALAAQPENGPLRWLHGDLHPANTIFVDGTLAAFIDFGDLCAGDPATDLAAAWMLLESDQLTAFRSAYGGVGHDLERRGRGWALLFGLMLLEIGLAAARGRPGGRPSYEPIGRRTLERLLAMTT